MRSLMVDTLTVGESKLIASRLLIQICSRPWAVDGVLGLTRSQMSGLLVCNYGLSGTRSLTIRRLAVGEVYDHGLSGTRSLTIRRLAVGEGMLIASRLPIHVCPRLGAVDGRLGVKRSITNCLLL